LGHLAAYAPVPGPLCPVPRRERRAQSAWGVQDR
jgi:hypothetical protein